MYGDLLDGPGAPTLPAPPSGALGAADSAGQRHLSASVAALRAQHVEFAHQAHHDLTQRLEGVGRELRRQEARRKLLAELAASSAQRRASLDARMGRMAELQTNLAARLSLLAQLHWSLPRPPSHAERSFKESELPGFERGTRQLEGDIKELQGRVHDLQRKARSMGQVAAAQAALAVQVPPQQLRRMREVLSKQEGQIEANLSLLGMLEEVLSQQA